MKKFLTLFLSLLTLYSLLFTPFPASAQENPPCIGPCIGLGERQKAGAIPGIKAFHNPNASPGAIISNALLILYILGGLTVLVFIVWGAFDWITSGGDKEKVSNARKKITNSLIGLAILSLAAFIVSLFGQIVGFNPLSPTSPPLPTLGDTPTTITPR